MTIIVTIFFSFIRKQVKKRTMTIFEEEKDLIVFC